MVYSIFLSYIFLCFAWLFVGSQILFNKAYFVIKSVEKTKVILTHYYISLCLFSRPKVKLY